MTLFIFGDFMCIWERVKLGTANFDTNSFTVLACGRLFHPKTALATENSRN